MERLRLAASPGLPNNSSVFPLGVAVNAKKLRFGCRPARLHHLVQAIFPVRFALLVLVSCRAENRFQLPRRFPRLAGVRLVHDHGIFPRRDGCFPLLCLLLLLLGRLFLALRARDVKQPAQHEGELLQRRDDDLGPVDQCRRPVACESWSIAFTTPCACSIW